MSDRTCPSTFTASRTRRHRGAAAVEMAMTLPLFVLIILGIVEFGRAMMVGAALTTAARIGARQASLDGSTNAAVEKSVRNFCSSTLNVPPGAVTVTLTVGTARGNDPAGNQVEKAQMGDLCTVDVQVPFDKVALFTPRHLAARELSATCAMEHE